MNKLLTKAEYDKLDARSQGYAQYMQGALRGSELKDLTNPYPEHSVDHQEWRVGQIMAVLHVQDDDD